METTGNADIDFTYAQPLMKAYPKAVYRKNLGMVKSVIVENDFNLQIFLPAGKTVKLTQVTEEGHLGLLLVIDIDYNAAHALPPFE